MKEHVTGKILNAEEMRSLRLKNSSVWLSKPAGSMLEQFRRENSCRPSMIPCISSLGAQESDVHRMSSNRHVPVVDSVRTEEGMNTTSLSSRQDGAS